MGEKIQRGLIWEIVQLDSSLKMSVFEDSGCASIRHYSQCTISRSYLNRLCGDINDALAKANNSGSLETGAFEGFKKNCLLLWDHLVTKSVKEKLKNSVSDSLVLILDEELLHVPWELLYTGDDFISLKFNLGRLVRTRFGEPGKTYRGYSHKLRMLIIANPTGDLSSSYSEGLYIKKSLEKKHRMLHVDFKSTRVDSMFIKKNIRDYDMVHFAGHCEYDAEKPEYSGWVLSDGRFSSRDIAELGDNFPSLIFAHSCHSAGALDGVSAADIHKNTHGLASSFLCAGVRHYIGSVRKIEDTVGSGFAREFYRQAMGGKTVGESVRLSRLHLTRQYGASSIFWAGYVLYGNPSAGLGIPCTRKSPRMMGFPSLVLTRWKRLCIAVCVPFFIALAAYFFLPAMTMRPGTYAQFLGARASFRSGENENVVRICENIIFRDAMFLPAYPLLAQALQRMGKSDEALKYYFQFVLYCQRKNDVNLLAESYVNIGWLYHGRGEYEKAKEFYQNALSISGKHNDKLHEAAALRKLAVWYMDKGEDNRALELLTKSSEINRERINAPGHRYNLACDYFDLGLVFSNKDDYTAAREFYSKSLALFQKMKRTDELSDYYFNLGEIYLFENNYEKALQNYMKGLKIDSLQGNRPSIASDYVMIGELYFEMGNAEIAGEYFRKAESLADEIGAPVELASAYYNLGLLYKSKSAENKAREYFRLAQEIYRPMGIPDYEEVKKELSSLGR
ncbi:MAG: tetratricopeptide repeat protein [Candidatus Omnitrophica bacterium]|nr:tetratricopeptide repeat protein [Candidatus Omnitrophota bacterium]